MSCYLLTPSTRIILTVQIALHVLDESSGFFSLIVYSIDLLAARLLEELVDQCMGFKYLYSTMSSGVSSFDFRIEKQP